MVIYTAISGGYDRLKDTQVKCGKFVAYVEKPEGSNVWEEKKIEKHAEDSNRIAKWYKLHPHILFPEEEISVWIDGSVEVTKDLNLLLKELGDFKWGVHSHYMRDCAYDEGMVCGMLKKDDADIISKQLSKYLLRERYPRNNGLAENTIIVRKHNDPDVIKVNEDWWNEILKHSKRDQISFDYICWKNNFKYTKIRGNVYSSPYFRVNKHD
jgi:hypothetical protein